MATKIRKTSTPEYVLTPQPINKLINLKQLSLVNKWTNKMYFTLTPYNIKFNLYHHMAPAWYFPFYAHVQEIVTASRRVCLWLTASQPSQPYGVLCASPISARHRMLRKPGTPRVWDLFLDGVSFKYRSMISFLVLLYIDNASSKILAVAIFQAQHDSSVNTRGRCWCWRYQGRTRVLVACFIRTLHCIV
jgi:hypothetical protein